MATNCLAPGYIKLFYTANAHNHVMTFEVIPSGSGANFELTQYNDSAISQADGLDTLVDFLRPLFKTTDSFTGWEAYTQLNCATAPVFCNAGSFVSKAGTSSTANRAWGQATLTFKSALGGRGKMQLMEGVFGADDRAAIVGLGGVVEDLGDYLISDFSIVWARDNSRFVLPLNYTTKTNDILRKKYLT